MNVLVINAGSSSIKFALFRAPGPVRILAGEVAGIGTASGRLAVESSNAQRRETAVTVGDHTGALELAAAALRDEGNPVPDVIGHRVVHGGTRFDAPVVVDDEVLAAIAETSPLAALHNPANLDGIATAARLWPRAIQVAVFDTAFHRTLPEHAASYAIPREWRQHCGVRRYGFHGISHAFVAKRAAGQLGRPLAALRLVTLHLGSGASAAAIAGGRCIDTSMGMTPLEGLVMGTRSGDLDPGALLYLLREHGFEVDDLERMLHRSSGLAGLCGRSDMREVHAAADAGDRDAALAIDVFCYRVRKYIGAYCAALGGIDALVFTGGIGENDPRVRERCCAGLEFLGIRVDAQRNAATLTDVMRIESPHGKIPVLVVATDEASEIARAAIDLLNPGPEETDEPSRDHPA